MTDIIKQPNFVVLRHWVSWPEYCDLCNGYVEVCVSVGSVLVDEGDAVRCNECGYTGVIAYDDDHAFAKWDEGDIA